MTTFRCRCLTQEWLRHEQPSFEDSKKSDNGLEIKERLFAEGELRSLPNPTKLL